MAAAFISLQQLSFRMRLDQENASFTLEHLRERKNNMIQKLQVGPAKWMVFEVAQSCACSLTSEQK